MSNPRENDGEGILLFYCRDCETTFHSQPDGTGYDQTPCPACGEVCMTVEFEREEQKRHRDAGLFCSVAGAFLGFLGFPSFSASETLNSALPPDRAKPEEPPTSCDAVTVRTIDDVAEAEVFRSLLEHFEIRAKVVQVDGVDPFTAGSSGKVLLQVSVDDVDAARRVLESYDAAKRKERKPPQDAAPIEFECEECGRKIAFPAHRRGGVEICPHCGEYVDVPE